MWFWAKCETFWNSVIFRGLTLPVRETSVSGNFIDLVETHIYYVVLSVDHFDWSRLSIANVVVKIRRLKIVNKKLNLCKNGQACTNSEHLVLQDIQNQILRIGNRSLELQNSVLNTFIAFIFLTRQPSHGWVLTGVLKNRNFAQF